MNEEIAFFGGALILFALHATVLLALVWVAERLGGLKHPGWAEFAWRAALFGAFFSVAFELLPGSDDVSGLPASTRGAVEASVADARVDAARSDARHDDLSGGSAATIAARTSRDAATVPVMRPSSDATTSRPLAASEIRPMRSAPRIERHARATTHREEVAATAPRAPWELDAGRLSWLLAAWSIGAALMALWTMRQAIGLRRLKRRVRRHHRPASAALQARVAALAAQMDVRAPRAVVLPDLASPLVLSKTVLLPRWAEGLDEVQQTAMLAHELAHLRRRDPRWRIMQRLALIPLFFHPLAWRAVHRLEALAETLCDRAAVERAGEDRNAGARALAECLAECLARQSEQRTPMWAVAMAEHSGGIVERVRQLLETSSVKFSSIPKRWRWGAVLAVLALLIALPGVLIVARDHDRSLSITYRHAGQHHRMTSSLPIPGDRLRIEIDGDVEFNAQESDVLRLGPHAYVEIEETRGRTTRAIRIVGKEGRIVRHYQVGEQVRPLDADGRAWLARTIPDIFRRTGFDAERRTKRMLGEGGPVRVMDEIDAITSDSVRVEYLGQLFAQGELDEAQFTRAMAQIEHVDSDFEKRRALGIALERDLFTQTHQMRLLQIAAGIDSDFERAEWLVQAMPKFEIADAERPQWAKTLDAFDSDFERRRALERMIETGRPQPAALAVALQSARGMDSDFERRSLLEAAAGSGATIVDQDYLQVVDAMDSDFEQREALLALIRSGMPSRERCEAVLRSTKHIESEFERGQVLDAVAEKMPADAELIRAYRTLTRDMSDQARGAAERALDRFENG
jgi:beta-lactamase regulating signal transducer with metallopeptidase domain